jgi:hypothetical protein
MRWSKRGLLLPAPVGVSWAVSHAALPVVHEDANGRLEMLFTARDGRGRSHIGAASIDLGNGRAIDVEAQALLDPGELGGFDDSGATSSCLVVDESSQRRYLFYTGWSLGVTVPFYLSAGLAISDDGGCSYRRASRAPILPCNDVDPFLTASPWVIRDSDRWRMWYVSGSGWEERPEGAPRHRYHIKYAESSDGISWQRTNRVCIDYDGHDEYAFGRPCVKQDGGVYRMWYCSRGSTYRIGYAESADGLEWERRDADVGIDLAPVGWDSEMQAYPIVVDHRGDRYLLYNGNGYGATGIGYAILASE